MHPGWVKMDMGGPRGEMTVQVSVSAMINTISHVTAENTGRYIQFDGSELPF